MSRKPLKHRKPAGIGSKDDSIVTPPRIIGGEFRGRKLLYSGDLRTRPMKDRVREAVFNLVGPAAAGKAALDLFAGTGALGLEALSRGSRSAVFVEQHFPTAELIRQNASALGVEDRVKIMPANTLLWSRRLPELPSIPWMVFCSPPYDFFVDRKDEMLALISALLDAAPSASVFVVEADDRFDFSQLPVHEEWDVRQYPPAVVGVLRMKPAEAEESSSSSSFET